MQFKFHKYYSFMLRYTDDIYNPNMSELFQMESQ